MTRAMLALFLAILPAVAMAAGGCAWPPAQVTTVRVRAIDETSHASAGETIVTFDALAALYKLERSNSKYATMLALLRDSLQKNTYLSVTAAGTEIVAVVTATPPPKPPFDACAMVSPSDAANLLGARVETGEPSVRDNKAAPPRPSSLCVYNGTNHAQLSVYVVRVGSDASERSALEKFRTPYEKAAQGMYGKPQTLVKPGVTIVTFHAAFGYDVAAYAGTSVARVTLTLGNADANTLGALAVSLARSIETRR